METKIRHGVKQILHHYRHIDGAPMWKSSLTKKFTHVKQLNSLLMIRFEVECDYKLTREQKEAKKMLLVATFKEANHLPEMHSAARFLASRDVWVQIFVFLPQSEQLAMQRLSRKFYEDVVPESLISVQR